MRLSIPLSIKNCKTYSPTSKVGKIRVLSQPFARMFLYITHKIGQSKSCMHIKQQMQMIFYSANAVKFRFFVANNAGNVGV